MKRVYGWMSSCSSTTSGECLRGETLKKETELFKSTSSSMNLQIPTISWNCVIEQNPFYWSLLHICCIESHFPQGCIKKASDICDKSDKKQLGLTRSSRSRGLLLSLAAPRHQVHPHSRRSATVCCFLPLLVYFLFLHCRQQDCPQPHHCRRRLTLINTEL